MVESNPPPPEICDNIPKYLGRRNFPWFPSCTWEPPVAPKLSLGQIFVPKLSLGTSKIGYEAGASIFSGRKVMNFLREQIREMVKHSSSHPPIIMGKADAELLELMEKNSVESATYRHCVTILQLRSMERTLRASNRLVWATWVLAFVTILLVLISFLK
jgi:hypothetical protein